mmetsp:Transcript_33100/g.89593  ORF Transcript_33100/g.89593 Transcript_33100/m.89593 type:complete len:400 (-) Transcript_33100:896-2095(-)
MENSSLPMLVEPPSASSARSLGNSLSVTASCAASPPDESSARRSASDKSPSPSLSASAKSSSRLLPTFLACFLNACRTAAWHWSSCASSLLPATSRTLAAVCSTRSRRARKASHWPVSGLAWLRRSSTTSGASSKLSSCWHNAETSACVAASCFLADATASAALSTSPCKSLAQMITLPASSAAPLSTLCTSSGRLWSGASASSTARLLTCKVPAAVLICCSSSTFLASTSRRRLSACSLRRRDLSSSRAMPMTVFARCKSSFATPFPLSSPHNLSILSTSVSGRAKANSPLAYSMSSSPLRRPSASLSYLANNAARFSHTLDALCLRCAFRIAASAAPPFPANSRTASWMRRCSGTSCIRMSSGAFLTSSTCCRRLIRKSVQARQPACASPFARVTSS